MRLFIASIPYEVDESELFAMFKRYSVAWVKLVRDDAGRSRGFGFAEIEIDSLADLAIAELDGSILAGRRIAVTRAEDRRAATRQR